MTAIRKHLSYANVMATLAVFIALGGGALAALRIPANSVGTRQLKRGAVTGIKVKPGSLNGKDIKPASLTGADVKPASLTGEDIAPGSLSAAQLPLIGLSNLHGASGTATNNAAIELEAGACERYVFAAPGAQTGDALMLQGSDIAELQHAFVGGATITNPDQINVSVCADAKHALSQPPRTVQLRFDTIG